MGKASLAVLRCAFVRSVISSGKKSIEGKGTKVSPSLTRGTGRRKTLYCDRRLAGRQLITSHSLAQIAGVFNLFQLTGVYDSETEDRVRGEGETGRVLYVYLLCGCFFIDCHPPH